MQKILLMGSSTQSGAVLTAVTVERKAELDDPLEALEGHCSLLCAAEL